MQQEQEKADRAAERAARRAQKLAAAIIQQKEAQSKKAERLAIRQAKLKAANEAKVDARGHKRLHSKGAIEDASKRHCAKPSQPRNHAKKASSKAKSYTKELQAEVPVKFSSNPVQVSPQRKNVDWVPKSRPLRSGRITKPPARFL